MCGRAVDAGEDRPWIGESREVVDVAVGVIALDALFQPEDFGDAESVAQELFDLRAAELRIAVGIEQHRLGGEELARAVDLDRTAFEDHAAFENPLAEGCGDAFAGIALSRSHGGNFPPQALNSQSVTATSPVSRCFTKIGP